MCQILKLDVSPTGVLLHLGEPVPSSGLLKNVKEDYTSLYHAKAYNESFNTTTVTAATYRSGDHRQLECLYIPPPLRGFQLMKLGLPAFVSFASATALYGVILASPALPFPHSLILFAWVTIILTLLVFLPSIWWAFHMYTHGAPPAPIERRMKNNYPDIHVYRNHSAFLADAASI